MRLKSRFLSFILVLLLTLSIVSVVPLRADAANIVNIMGRDMSSDVAAGELLIKFKPGTADATENTIHNKLKAKVAKKIAKLGVDQVEIPKGLTVDDAIKFYKKYREVEYVEPNHILSALQVPNDALYASQWAFAKMNAPAAWDIATGTASVIIAVVDTGVDYNHAELAGKVIKGYDYINNDADPIDDEGHGTHVAGIAAATTNNGAGIAGMSWGSKVLAVKVLNAAGNGTDVTVSNGITYAADNGAKIINLSLGGAGYSVTMANAVQYARNAGCLVIAAAGNEGDGLNRVSYPAAYHDVLCVAATDRNDAQSSYSNYGWYVDVSAPGGDDMGTNPAYGILSCWPGGGYAWAEGTSMATPYVAGLAALIAAKYPSRTADQIAWTIQEAAHDLGAAGRDDRFGFGRINAQESLEQSATGLEETNGGITYTGAWNTVASVYASGGSYKTASNIGSEITYEFNGTHVTWLTKTGPSEGIADVYLDGVLQDSVDLYDAQDPWQYIGFNADNLAPGAHTLRIEATGTKNVASSGTEVIIDALDVEGVTISGSPLAPIVSGSGLSFGMDTNVLLAIALLLTVIGASLVFKKTYKARHAKRFLH